MMNSVREISLTPTSRINYVMAKLFSLNAGDHAQSMVEDLPCKQTRARILPKPANKSCIFAPDTVSWLSNCAINTAIGDPPHQTIVYTVPLLGITNRPLAGYRKAGFNLFKTMIKMTIPANVRNFDQCTIEFGSRVPVSTRDFQDELYRQICLSSPRVKTKGRLSFYAHGHSSIAAMTDLEALRLCALKAMPIINIDWLDSSSSWERLWNPCAILAPIKSKLETKLIDFIDNIVVQACASQCNAIIKSPNSFFDSIYLRHRRKEKLPDFNKIIFLPTSLQSDRSVDPLDAEYNLLNYLSSNLSRSKRKQLHFKPIADEGGWMPVTI